MTQLPSLIRDYYYSNLKTLPVDKQFHFASRLGSWSNDPRALEILEELKPTIATSTIEEDLSSLIHHPPQAKINAAERRAPYFAKYPQLRGYMLALFRVRHLLFHYNIDAREKLLELIPKSSLYELSESLQADKESVSVLSTYAINYIYLVEIILFPRKNSPIPKFNSDILTLASKYSDSAEDSLLLIYLLTHCIIGASNFYQSKVAGSTYQSMLSILDNRIEKHFTNINLDNKFEFKVCCKLASFTSNLSKLIEEEAQKSISSEGVFLIDTMNTAGQANKTSFADSEHRNVLYIMSTMPFKGDESSVKT